MSDLLKLDDSDTGESHLDVVRVPEGFSLQMGMRGGAPMPDDFISIILSRSQAKMVVEFLGNSPLLKGERFAWLRPVPMREEVNGAPVSGYFGDGDGNIYALVPSLSEVAQ